MQLTFPSFFLVEEFSSLFSCFFFFCNNLGYIYSSVFQWYNLCGFVVHFESKAVACNDNVTVGDGDGDGDGKHTIWQCKKRWVLHAVAAAAADVACGGPFICVIDNLYCWLGWNRIKTLAGGDLFWFSTAQRHSLVCTVFRVKYVISGLTVFSLPRPMASPPTIIIEHRRRAQSTLRYIQIHTHIAYTVYYVQNRPRNSTCIRQNEYAK